MPALDHSVTFQDHGQPRSVFVPEDEFVQGPPEVDVTGRVEFVHRSPAEQTESWRRWLEAGHDLALLDEARTAVREAQQRFPVPLPSTMYHVAELPQETVRVDVRKNVVYGVLGGPPAPAPQTVEFDLDRRNFDVGPPDLPSGFDPGFRSLDDATKIHRWQTYLADHDAPPDLNSMRAQRYFLDALAAGPVLPPAEVNRCLDCLCVPGRTWSLVVLALLGLGGAGYGFYELFRPGSPVGTPTGVTARVTTGLVEGSRVTVTWTAPTTGPAPTGYAVTLRPATGDQRGVDADGAATSAVFDAVADGTYTVTVTAVHDVDLGPPGVTTVTVTTAQAPPPPPTSAPGPPTAVTLTVGLSAVTGQRTVTAAWNPPTSGGEPSGYTVTLVGVAPATVNLPVAVGLMTSLPFPGLAAGTYRVEVTASNAAGMSTATTSAVVAFSPVAAAVPDAPRHLAAHVSGSRAPGGNAAVVVTWDRPDTGTEVAGYDVTLTPTGAPAGPLRRVGAMTSSTHDPVDDGTYDITVVTYNAAGKGAAATAAVTVDHTTIDPDGLDWTPVLGSTQIAAWKALKAPVSRMTEDDLWSHVLDVLEDKTGAHGGLAPYTTMRFVARLLTLWIDVPAAEPTDRQVGALAGQIAAACSPPFPATPPRAGQEYTDRLAVWRAARTIRNPTTGAPVVLRYKLFGLAAALERYLGVRT